MKVSFLTTVRCIDESRLINLQKVISDISDNYPDWEIIVVEQNDQQTLESKFAETTVKYIHVYNPGPFNKSLGMNVAFKKSSGDILVVCDADMLLQKSDLERAVKACEEKLDAVRPYGKLIDMTEQETAEYMHYGKLPMVPEKAQGFDRIYDNEVLCMAGGVFVIRSEFYKLIGGMDERFSGWGGEDDAMSIKIQTMSSKVAISNNATAWHLWHPRGDRYSHEGYAENGRLLHQYQLMSKGELSNLCLRHSKTFANVIDSDQRRKYVSDKGLDGAR